MKSKFKTSWVFLFLRMKITLKFFLIIATVMAGINNCAAIDYLKDSSEIFPQVEPFQKPQKSVEESVKQVDKLYENGEQLDVQSKKIIYRKAIKKYNKIICFDDCPEILKDECLFKLANCHFKLGEVKAAADIYIQLVELSSIVDRHAEIFNRLGGIEAKNKNYLKAISYYEKSIKVNKEKNARQAHNYYMRGRAMQGMIAQKKMMEWMGGKDPTYFLNLIDQNYEWALTLKSPEGILYLPSKLRAQCLFQRALLAKSRGQYEEAQNFCQNVLEEWLSPPLKEKIENLQSIILKVKNRENELELKTDFFPSD